MLNYFYLFSNSLDDPFLLTKWTTICLHKPSTQAAVVKCVIAHAPYNWAVFGSIRCCLALKKTLSVWITEPVRIKRTKDIQNLHSNMVLKLRCDKLHRCHCPHPTAKDIHDSISWAWKWLLCLKISWAVKNKYRTVPVRVKLTHQFQVDQLNSHGTSWQWTAKILLNGDNGGIEQDTHVSFNL